MAKPDLVEAIALRDEALKYRAENKLRFFDPYPYQKQFCDQSLSSWQILLMAANRIGKSECGAFSVACHLTGIYPKWWEGRRWDRPIKAWAAGINNDKTRDILQAKLCGEPGNPQDWGRGFIPKSLLGETIRKPGVPNALQGVYVKHISGGLSYLGFKSYEMEAVGFMGESIDLGWPDEEPSQPIYSQFLTRILDKRGLIHMTFTPESGVTDVVGQFMNDIKPGQCLLQATWDDASDEILTIGGKPGHLDKKMREQILSAYPVHEREMRSKGTPMHGSGLVFPLPDEDLYVDPFEIPDYYLRVCGLDFGVSDHPTAAVFGAYNPDTDIFYVYDCYKQKALSPVIHASALKSRGCDWIPVIWPHDGNRQAGYGDATHAELYRKEGLNMHFEKFSNPPSLGFAEGEGNNSIEPGIGEMLNRMSTGRFKVFKNLNDWFSEKRMYHRKDGKILAKNDDLMAATRYACLSLRHAVSKNYAQMAKRKLIYPGNKSMGIV